MAEIIKDYEKPRKHVYTDTNSEKPKKTVGVGFNLDQPGARATFKKYVPAASFDNVRNGKQSLTDKQVEKLYEGTLNEKVKKTKDIFPSYNTYPKAVQTALVNGVFRGEFKKSHKTVEYINKGQWDKVPEEYVDRKDYRDTNQPGVKTRMNFNKKIFQEYAKELKKGD